MSIRKSEWVKQLEKAKPGDTVTLHVKFPPDRVYHDFGAVRVQHPNGEDEWIDIPGYDFKVPLLKGDLVTGFRPPRGDFTEEKSNATTISIAIAK